MAIATRYGYIQLKTKFKNRQSSESVSFVLNKAAENTAPLKKLICKKYKKSLFYSATLWNSDIFHFVYEINGLIRPSNVNL